MTTEPIDPLLSKAKLKELGISYSRQYLWELERDGRFPKRVQLTERTHGWPQSEIAAWLRGRVDARNRRQNEQAAAGAAA